jgi:hypothetical protein
VNDLLLVCRFLSSLLFKDKLLRRHLAVLGNKKYCFRDPHLGAVLDILEKKFLISDVSITVNFSCALWKSAKTWERASKRAEECQSVGKAFEHPSFSD